MDRVWVEPATSWLRVRYSINWTTTPTESGDVYENVKVGWHKGRLWIDRLRGCMYCLNVRSLFALCAVFCFYFFSSASSCKINWLHVKGQGLQVLLPLKQWSQLRFHCTTTLNRVRVMTGLKGLSWPCCVACRWATFAERRVLIVILFPIAKAVEWVFVTKLLKQCHHFR